MKTHKFRLVLVFLTCIMSLQFIPPASAGPSSRIMLTRQGGSGVRFTVEFGDSWNILQWMHIDMDNLGRFQFNNHFQYDDYYFMQQFNIHQFSIITDSKQWDASFETADSVEGTENIDDGRDEIDGIEYSDRWVHVFWAKAYNIDLIETTTQTTEGTIDVKLDYTLTTYYDRNELKVGITVDLAGAGLPISENSLYILRINFENSIEDRTNHEYGGGPWLVPDSISTYSATYNLPNGKNASTFELNRDYVELKDDQQISRTADPQISEPSGSRNFLHGEYDFTDLKWGHTTQVALDPTLITYGKFGEIIDTSGGIKGFHVEIMLFLTLLGIIVFLLRFKKNKF